MGEQNYSVEDVTVAVLNYNGIDKIPDLFSSIRSLDHLPAEVIMVDDGSTDSSSDWVEENFSEVRVIRLESFPNPGTWSSFTFLRISQNVRNMEKTGSNSVKIRTCSMLFRSKRNW